MGLDLNLTYMFVYLMLLAIFVGLGLYWMISLFMTVIRASNSGRSLLDYRSFFQFIVVNILLVINSVMFYLLIKWPSSHPGQELFKKDDLYPFAWFPLCLILIVGIGEAAYRKFSNVKNPRSVVDAFRDGVEKWNSTT